MIRFAMDCIPITKKVVQQIMGKDKLVCERYVELKEFDMIKHILGRIDYESKTKFIELKTKPPNLRKVKGKEEWNMITQELPDRTYNRKPYTNFVLLHGNKEDTILGIC